MQSTIEFRNYVENATKLLRGYGLHLRWGRDFRVFRRIITRHNERYEPAPGFNPDSYTTGMLDGLWLVAHNKAGDLVHTQASRRVVVSPDMHEHLKLEANAYEPAYLKFDLNNMEVHLSPSAAKISGEAIYHGEAWLKGGPDGIRGSAALYIFSRMMMAKALLNWDVDYIFGLITPFTGIKGLPQRYGYTRCEQGTIVFSNRALPNDLWLVWMTAEEVRSQLKLGPEYFADLIAASQKKPVDKVA